MIKVENFQITELRPKVNNPEFEKLLPKTHIPAEVSFEISPVSNAVSNAIRRTLTDEFPVKCMYVSPSDISSTDPFIIPEMVAKRFRMVPVDQSCPISTKFEMNVVNTTPIIRDVKSSEIAIVSGPKKLPFNDTFTMFTVGGGKVAKVKNITIREAYGYNIGDGMHSIASSCSSTTLDQQPYDAYKPEAGGVHSRNSESRKWLIRFITHGTMTPEDILAKVCDVVIDRINLTREMFQLMQSSNGEHALTVPGESDTVGNLFMKTVCELYPDIPAITYSVEETERVCTIKLRCNEEPDVILDNAANHIISIFEEIRKVFA